MGGAIWAFRLEIEGLGYEPVTDPGMEQSLTVGTENGRERIVGLKRDGLSFSESVDLMRAKTTAKGMTAKIVDRQVDSIWTTALASNPGATTWLTATMSSSTTSMSVTNTDEFAIGDIVHLGTEAMRVTAVPGVTTLTVSRAHWGSIAQKHYTQEAENLSRPMVSRDSPPFLEGRRCRLYRYKVGTDDLQGDGTQIWCGFVSGDAKLASNAGTWSLKLDSPYTLFKQDMGGALEDELGPIGISIPATHPVVITVTERQGERTYSTVADSIEIKIDGYFKDQDAFVAAINEKLQTETTTESATGVSGWDAEWILAISDGAAGWHFEYEVGSSSYTTHFSMDHPAEGQLKSSAIPRTISVGTVVTHTPDRSKGIPGAGKVPRGGVGGADLTPYDPRDDGRYVYVGGTATITANHVLLLEFGEDGESVMLDVTAFDSTTRKATVIPVDQLYWYGADTGLQITLARSYVKGGSLADLRDELVSIGPEEANLGSVPFFTDEDLADWTVNIAASYRGRDFQTTRYYDAAASFDAADLLEHEARLLNGYWAQEGDGRIGFKQLRVPTITDFSEVDLDESQIILGNGGFPRWERMSMGSLNTVIIKTGWDHKEEEHTGTTITVRDVQAVSARKAMKVLEIAPRSRWTVAGIYGVALSGILDYEEAVQIAQVPLSIFGRTYATLDVTVNGATDLDLVETALCGEFVTVSSSVAPNGIGARGWVSQPAVIISRSWDLASGVGSLKLLTVLASRAGYAPSLRVTANAVVSGNQYDLTVTDTDFNGDDLYPAGSVPSDFIRVDHRLDLVTFDSTGMTPVVGTVDQWNNATSIRVTFDSAPSFSGEQYLRFADASEADGTQPLYAYFADDSAEIDFSTTQPAKVYS